MGDLFKDGDQGSRSALIAALSTIQTQGQSVLDELAQIRLETLVNFEQGLSALMGRRQRTNRLLGPDTAAIFSVSDFTDIDQALSSATIRSDSQSVTLQERPADSDVQIASQTFSASEGSIEQFTNMYQVYLDNGDNPVGTFDLQLTTPLNLSLLSFDLVVTPSNPAISIETSSDGIVYTPVLNTSQNGNRVNAWLPSISVKYLRVKVIPNHPDTIGGHTFTFGLTNFSAILVSFQLQSELVTKAVTVSPSSNILQLNYDQQPGVLAFLSLNGGSFVGLSDGSRLNIPGSAAISTPLTAYVDVAGVLWWQDGASFTKVLPSDLYQASLRVTNSQGNSVRLAFGLGPSTAQNLKTPVFTISNQLLTYCPFQAQNPINEKFSVSYMRGPAQLTANLRVQLQTRDRSQTPVFRGAFLQNIY